MKPTTRKQDAQYKVCASCGKSKELTFDNFYGDTQTKDKFSVYCKACKADKQLIKRYRSDKKKKGIAAFNNRINLVEHHLRLMRQVRDEK